MLERELDFEKKHQADLKRIQGFRLLDDDFMSKVFEDKDCAEFLNRLDEIIMFKPLTKDNIGGIIELMLADVNKRLEDKELSIHLTDAAKSYVIEHGYEPAYGARPLKRYLTKHVDTLAARMILSGEVYPQDTIVIDEQGGELIASVEHRQ